MTVWQRLEDALRAGDADSADIRIEDVSSLCLRYNGEAPDRIGSAKVVGDNGYDAALGIVAIGGNAEQVSSWLINGFLPYIHLGELSVVAG